MSSLTLLHHGYTHFNKIVIVSFRCKEINLLGIVLSFFEDYTLDFTIPTIYLIWRSLKVASSSIKNLGIYQIKTLDHL